MAKYTVVIDDQDAIDAIDAECKRIEDAGGPKYSAEDYLADFVTTQHVLMREPQLRTAAQAKVESDPDLMAFKKRQTDKADAAKAAQVAEVAKINP